MGGLQAWRAVEWMETTCRSARTTRPITTGGGRLVVQKLTRRLSGGDAAGGCGDCEQDVGCSVMSCRVHGPGMLFKVRASSVWGGAEGRVWAAGWGCGVGCRWGVGCSRGWDC